MGGYPDIPLKELKRASRERKGTPQRMGAGRRFGGGEMRVGERISQSKCQTHGDYYKTSEEEIRWIRFLLHNRNAFSPLLFMFPEKDK